MESIKSEESKKKISIIITFDEIGNVKKTIDSCLVQSYKNIEILLILNQGISLTLDEYQNRNIKVLKNNNNSINKKILAAKKSSGELILFLENGDRFLSSDSLKELVKIWEKYNNLDILSFNYLNYDETNEKFSKPPTKEIIKNNLVFSKKIDFFISTLNLGQSFNFKKIYKSDFFNKKIKESENIFLDDTVLNHFLFLNANKIAITKYIASISTKHFEDKKIRTLNISNEPQKYFSDIRNTIEGYTNIIKKNHVYNKTKDFFDYFLAKSKIDYYLEEKKKLLDQNNVDTNLFDEFCKTFEPFSQIDILIKDLSILNKKNNEGKLNFKYDISIIIPIFNTEIFLKRCIESILKNVKNNIKIQIILINDCSPGNVQEIYKNELIKYEFITLHNNKWNMGSFYSRLKGLLYVESPWVHFVDADDLVEENAYIVLKKIRSNIDCVFANYSLLYDDKRIENKQYQFRKKNNKKPFEFYLKNTKLNRSLWNKLFRFDLCIKSINKNILVANTSVSDDHFLNIMFLSNCKRMKIINNSIYSYFVSNDESISASVEFKENDKFELKKFTSNNTEKDNLKLLKYLDQRELSYININNFIKTKLKKKKIKYYWNVNRYIDATYSFIPLIKKEYNLFFEFSSNSENIFYPLKIEDVIISNLHNNEAINFFKESKWKEAPKTKFGFSLLKYSKILFSNNPFYLLKILYKKLFNKTN